ncbi:hypothetical protein [Roseomonas xinghualingensis]|uniref:hypothetical protein n=1 Tax=Roseomonas xinghualingensis TaxID=2986475 RepID=UPI0021F0C1F6|nr:hypothetical protein [Roseomonas sp. SXEYE001]MCV4209289.1 hypothetical protein [Roseomonas sp. SXEYE001]
MPPSPVPELAGLAYDAATGSTSWHEVGLSLKACFGAATASLWLGDPGSGQIEMLYAENLPQEATQAYIAHFHTKDPWTNGALLTAKQAPDKIQPALLGHQILPYEAYRRSEFYADFARDIGLYHLVGTVLPVGDAGFLPLGLHRPEGSPPFTEMDRAALDNLLPHLHRALRLRHRLRQANLGEAAGIATLEALPLAAIVVDRDLRVVFANAAAEALNRNGSGLRLLRTAPPPSPVLIRAAQAAEATALSNLLRAVALAQSAGGSLRITPESEAASPSSPSLAVLVTHLPARLAPAPVSDGRRAVPGHALVIAREIGSIRRPAPALLADLFGLSLAEASVAAALAGGTSAESVAEERKVEVSTIRGQIRTILGKTGAANLRDLERILATLAIG